MLKAEQPKVWYKYTYGTGITPAVEIITVENDSYALTSDPSITFALYRKEQTQTTIGTKRGTFTSVSNMHVQN